MLNVMNESTHDETLSQPLQTNYKQFKIAITFLNVYTGLFNVTTKKNEFCLITSINDEESEKLLFHQEPMRSSP